jgi:tRNA G18 (ribose-2'-O)-methylase SpoU
LPTDSPSPNILLLLDKINTVNELGLLVKSSLYLGADQLIFNQEEKHLISPQLAFFSKGVSELRELYCIKFIKKFLEDAKNQGFLIISLTSKIEQDPSKVVLSEFSQLLKSKMENKKKFIIILNSNYENRHQNSTDFNIYIPPMENKNINTKLNAYPDLSSSLALIINEITNYKSLI